MIGFLKKKITAESACAILVNDMATKSIETFDEFLADFKILLDNDGRFSDKDVTKLLEIMRSRRSYNLFISTVFVKSMIPVNNIFNYDVASRIENCIFNMGRDVFEQDQKSFFTYISKVYNYLKINQTERMHETVLFVKNLYERSEMEQKISILLGPMLITHIDLAIDRAVFVRYFHIFHSKYKII